MSERVKALFLCATLALSTAPAAAQVGYPPARSPFIDLEYNQELSVLGGYLRARHDPAGVAPLSRPVLGLRYEWGLTGPLALSSEVSGGGGERNIVDPLKPGATRMVGTQSNGVYAADIALALNLTGRRSWNRLVPQIRAGAGLVRSGARDDSSGFAFGTRFAFTFGGGVKYVPGSGSRLQLRADITNRVFKLSYPDAYYRLAPDNTAVLSASTARSFYTRHTGLTVGVSYLFSR